MSSIPASPARCAILLDELDGFKLHEALAVGPEGRHIVVELKTANALPLIKYACSSRVRVVPTGQLNAQRVRVVPAGGGMRGCGRCCRTAAVRAHVV